MICVTEFRIDGSGQAQVKSHATSKGHVSKVATPKSQRVLKFATTGELSDHTDSGGGMSVAKQALRAEIINTLHTAEYNHSLSSTSADGERFRQMFPGHPAAENYKCSSSKTKYTLRFGISDFSMKELKSETTTGQVKKQYDVYICYWSPMYDQIVNTYGGTLFIGHCDAADLVKHFDEITKKLELHMSYLVHLGMDGPRLNEKFERDLEVQLGAKDEPARILKIGTCSLHPVHTAFKKGLAELELPFESFFNDLSFFKLSPARLYHK